MDVTVRQATADDAEPVAAVINAVIAEGALTLFDRPFSTEEERRFIASLGRRSALFVAEIDDVIAGVQSIDRYSNLAESTSHVATMGTWLRRDVRRRGVGTRLASSSIAFARSSGYTKIVIHVLAGNTPALRFYRRLGFSDIGLARAHVKLPDGLHDEVFLERMI